MFRARSRKRLDQPAAAAASSSDYTQAVLSRGAQPVTSAVAQSAVTCIEPEGAAAPKTAFASAANYRANDPQTDSHILQADSQYLFAAVLCAQPSARGAHYLRQHLHGEVQAQLRLAGGDAPQALLEALRRLDTAFRGLHPCNAPVLEGVRLAVALVDLRAGLLHLGSSGGCGCVVGCTDGELVATEAGQQQPGEAARDWGPPSITTVPLGRGAVDTIVLGSPGFWQEVSPGSALLRLQHFHTAAPAAHQGSAAAHLANLALHRVATRLRGHADPRMRSLRSVSSLQSLPAGDVSQFKWAGRQPVRRRRGDVHGDLTAVVLRLDWRGDRSALQAVPAPSGRARWALARLHFLDFPRALRAATRQRWRAVVHQALAARRSGEALAETAGQAKAAAHASQRSRQPSFDVSARAVAAKAG